MFCRECGKSVNEHAVACTSCGVNPRASKNFCYTCGVKTKDNQVMCVKCGVSLESASSSGISFGENGKKDKMIAFVLALVLGTIGAHKFYLGYKNPAIIMLICGTIGWILVIPALVMAVIALIEAIIYITKSDEEFQMIYVDNEKGWF
jgi:TM2 domain-containing membrane protein YozV